MRILFLTHRLPFAPNRGDRIRAYYFLREMSRFAEISLFSFVHDDDEASHAGNVPFAHRTVTVRPPRFSNLLRGFVGLPSNRPLTHALLDAPEATRSLERLVADAPPDVVVAYCSGMARFAMEPPLNRFPSVVDLVDVDSAKWAQLADTSRGPRRWVYQREAKTLRRFEAEAICHARTTLVVNDREQTALAAIATDARVTVVPNGIDVPGFSPPHPPSENPVVIFCGVMNYQPNEEGVLWFARHVWPLVVENRPDARFRVVGSNPTPSLQALAETDRSIEIVGAVPQVQPFLWRSAVSVAPLHLARGLQNKVLEALAAGLPVVATPIVLDGIPPAARPGCLRANAAGEFADSVLRLLDLTPEQRRQLASRAKLDGLTWDAQLQRLERILRGASGENEVPASEAAAYGRVADEEVSTRMEFV